MNVFLKIKSSFLLLITKIKSLFQKQNSNNKNITTEAEDNQQHNQSEKQSDGPSSAGEEPDIWFDAEGKTESEIDEEELEEEFFDALGYDEDPKNENTIKIEEDEGYISSSSQGENTATKNIIVEDDQYYSINGLQKLVNLSSYSNDTLALAFSGEATGKITNTKHSLASLHYNESTKLIRFVHNAGNTKDSNLFSLIPNSFNIYMPSYFMNKQSKPPEKAFGNSQVVILLQKPESVNLPTKGFINESFWWSAEKLIGMANNPIKIDDDFPFDFINFSCSNNASVSQFIDRKSPNTFTLSLIDNISNKQEKIDWDIKNILVRGDCISLTKELTDVKHLDDAKVEQINNNQRNCA